MKVRDRMSLNPTVGTTEMSVPEAFQLMKDKSIRRLPVMENGKLVGIVTIKDLSEVGPSNATSLSIFEINYLLAKTKLKDVIKKNRPLITIQSETNLERAAVVMRENKIGAIPVLEGEKLVGIITETDIFGAFIDILGVNARGTRIDLIVEDRIGMVAQVSGLMAEMNLNIQNIVMLPTEDEKMSELILRLDTLESEKVVQALKERGFNVVQVVEKNR